MDFRHIANPQAPVRSVAAHAASTNRPLWFPGAPKYHSSHQSSPAPEFKAGIFWSETLAT